MIQARGKWQLFWQKEGDDVAKGRQRWLTRLCGNTDKRKAMMRRPHAGNNGQCQQWEC